MTSLRRPDRKKNPANTGAEERAELVLLLEELRRRQAAKGIIPPEQQARQDSLAEFVRAAWHLLEPSTKLVWNWHLDALCMHLQAVSDGRIKRLIINVPPGTSKSTVVSVLWPCWEWIRRPTGRWLFASHKDSLALRDSCRRRAVFTSPWYQEQWGNIFTDDTLSKHEFHNGRGGYMISMGTGGVTGLRGDRLVLDDPNSTTEMESELMRENKLLWYDLQWVTRMNDGGAQVVIQQRSHEKDLSGHILGLNDPSWVHLCIPMEYEPERRCVTTLGWSDPRTVKGELLDPVRYPRERVEELKHVLGPYGASGQLQQNPAPSEGGIINRSWIRHYSTEEDGRLVVDGFKIDPMGCVRFCIVDPAVQVKQVQSMDPDFTVMGAFCAVPSERGPYLILLDLVRERIPGPDIIPRLKALHQHWKFSLIGVETFGFQLMLFQQALRERLPVREISSAKDALYCIDRDKIARAYSATSLLADGRFWVPTYAPWLGEFMTELTRFPVTPHDDQVDVVSAAVAVAQKLRLTSALGGSPKTSLTNPESGDILPISERDDRSESAWDAVRVAKPYR